MNAAATPGNGAPPPVGYLARRALRFWRPAAVVFAVMVVGTLIFARSTWQPYKSEAVLMYDQTVTREMGGFDPAQAGARLKEMLHRTERIRAAIQKYNLFPDLSTAAAIEEVKKRLEFTVQPGGTFSLAYIGFSPQEAQSVLKDMTDGLIADHDAERGKQLKGNRELLVSERARLEAEVQRLEVLVKDFVGKYPAVASLNENDAMVIDPRIALLEQELKQALSAPSTGGGDAPARSITDLLEARRTAETNVTRAQQELQDKLITLTEAHPDVISARDRLARAQENLNKTRSQIDRQPSAGGGKSNGREEEVRGIRSQLDALRASSRRPKDPKMLQLGVQYDDLRHNLGEARTRLSKLQDQEVQMSVAEKMEKGGNLLRLVVHDPASLPGSPMQSRRRRTAMGGLFLAIVLAAGTAFARSITSDRLFDRQDIANLAGVPVLAVIPALPKPRGRRG
jgi:succinoglycan biosynthesis transport protein ExoP